MMRLSKFILVAGLCLSICCRKDDRPTTTPLARPATSPTLAQLRTEMLAMVGDPPAGGILPEALTWSPSGATLAFLRQRPFPRQGKELWIHEISGHRDRPLSGQRSDLGVNELCFVSDDELVIIAGGDLRLMSLPAGQEQPLTKSEALEHDIACAPNSRKVAFVRDEDVYVLDMATKVETRLTTGGSADLTHGEVPWLYSEELDFGPGLIWSKDGKKLLWLTTDLKGVRRASVRRTGGENLSVAYPRPGETLPRASLTTATFGKGDAVTTTRLETGRPEDSYLVRPVWHPSGAQVLVWRLDRLQTLLELLACDAKGACRVLSEQRDPRFLEPPKAVVCPGAGDELLVLSSASGFTHIHVLSRDGLNLRQLTTGEFDVRSIDAVNEAEGLVHFTANIESTGELGLFSVPQGGGKVRRVSDEPGCHSAVWNGLATRYADTSSDVDRSPRTQLRSLAEEQDPVVLLRQDLSPYKPPRVTTDFFELETPDGRVLRAMLTRPEVLAPSERYPVLIYTYGGPGVQVVSHRFNRKFSAWRDSMARRGVLVFSLDGRGSSGYGRDNEIAIHTKLLGPDLEDQIAGLTYLLRQPYADPKRIGVFGWSYGGFMALALATHPESGKRLRAVVAVAPVTNFGEYDATYTERYLQRPTDNPEGYARTNLVAQARHLSAPLLLVHGLADDNVYFDHSAQMLRALIEAGRPVETAFYPDEGHGLRGNGTLADAMARITDFLLRNL